MKNFKILLTGLILQSTFDMQAQSVGNINYNSSPASANAILDLSNSNYNISANMSNSQYGYQSSQQPYRGPATNAVPDDNEFTIKVNGLLNAVATNYVAVFNIVQVGETAQSSDSMMNATIDEFKYRLGKIKIDTSDIKIDMISFVPKYGFQQDKKIFSHRFNEVPDGFELEKNIYVRFKRSSTLDGILSAAAACEIYDLVKVDYFLPNAQKLIDSLRMRCLEEVKTRMKTYQIIGFRLDTMTKTFADNFQTIFPDTRYYSYSAYSRPSLASLKKKSTDQPFVGETAKPVSRYYNQVNYDNYDIIMNPVITEPVVQLSYTVAVKYSFKNERPQVATKEKKVYYFITSTGEVHELPIE